jgi:hypothetical protein
LFVEKGIEMSRPRRWELEALDPADPAGTTLRKVFVDQGTVEFITKNNLYARFNRLLCAKDVLLNPSRVFQGWNRNEFDDGLCYVGRPSDHPKDGITLPPRPGQCFFAFVLPSGKMEEWRWEDFSLDNEADFEREFGANWRCLWPPTGKK